MTLPQLSVSSDRAVDVEADALVVAVSSGKEGIRVHAPVGLELDVDGLSAIGVTGARDEVVRVGGTGTAARAVALVGVGSGPLDAVALRYAVGSAIRQLRGVDRVAVAVPVTSLVELTAVLEGAALGVYSFDSYRRDSLAGQKPRASAVTVVAQGDSWTAEDADEAIAHALAVAGAVAGTKDLVNTPPLDLYPATFVDAVRERTSGLPVDVRVWDEEALAADGFGGILGVGQGSTRPPRLVKVAYSPAGATRHLALVGKGITYDTGGISLKPRRADDRHEVRHDRRRLDPGGRGRRRAARAAGPPDGLALHRGEHAVRVCDPPRRRAAHARGHDRRGPEHGRRGAPRDGGRHRRRERGAPGRHRRHRDSHGRAGRGAR
ncbi:leucyl aminopeptidase [Clavibacter michiganensis]